MSRNSDRRKIKDVREIKDGLDLLDKLKVIGFKHKDEDPAQVESIGFEAQNFYKVFPQWVRKRAIDDGEGPIKDPVFEKPPRKPKPGQPGRPGTPTEPEPPAEGEPETPPADPENPTPPVEEEPEPPFTPDPVSEPVGGFTIMSYEVLIPVLVAAINELAKTQKNLKQRIADLEGRVPKA